MSSSSSSNSVRVTFLIAISWRTKFCSVYFLIFLPFLTLKAQCIKLTLQSVLKISWVWLINLKYLSIGTDQGGLQQVSSAPRGLSLPHQVSGGTVGSTSTGGPDLTTVQQVKEGWGNCVHRCAHLWSCWVKGAAYRDPLAGLQGELHWELEEDGSTRSHLPLQLPVPQVLILTVGYKVSGFL